MSEQSGDSEPASDRLKPVVELKGVLAELPQVGFMRRAAANRAESGREDMIWNVQSLDALVQAGRERLRKAKSPMT